MTPLSTATKKASGKKLNAKKSDIKKPNGKAPSSRLTFSSFFLKIAAFLCTAFVCLLTIGNFILVRHTTSKMGEAGHWEVNLIFLPITIILLVIIAYLTCFKFFKNISNKSLLFILLLYGVLASIFCYAIWNPEFLADSETLQQYATGADIGTNYISINPQQLGYLFIMLPANNLFTNGQIGLFLINILCLLVTFVALYHITNLLFNKEQITRIVLILLFGFTPLILLTLMFYNDFIALSLSMIAIWQTLSLKKTADFTKKSWLHILVIIISMAGAIIIRQNSLIIFIAIILYLIFTLSRRAILPSASIIVGTLLLFWLGQLGLKSFFTNYFNVDMFDQSNDIPAISFIAMGMGIEDEWSGRAIPRRPYEEAGWFNDYNFECSNFGKDKCTELSMAAIKTRLKEFLSDPGLMFNFYLHKTLSQWNDPTFQYPAYTITNSDEESNQLLKFNFYYSNIYHLLILSSASCYVFYTWKKKQFTWHLLLPLIAIFGYFLFSILWEAKSRYVFLVFPLILPYAAAGIYYLSTKKQQKINATTSSQQ